MNSLNLECVHVSWRPIVEEALSKIDQSYLQRLCDSNHWLPGCDKIFNAFSLPVDQVNYVLFGESPYPRAQSANGYAFWDAAVGGLWASGGLDKAVNRATSLRNFIKMLLVAEGLLGSQDTGQEAISYVDKSTLVQTNKELFGNLLRHGFLLLNATLVLQPKEVQRDAKSWQPFVKHILDFLFGANANVQLILFGNIANAIDRLVDHFEIKRLYAEHPYNISFVNNADVINFFKPLHLLKKPQHISVPTL